MPNAWPKNRKRDTAISSFSQYFAGTPACANIDSFVQSVETADNVNRKRLGRNACLLLAVLLSGSRVLLNKRYIVQI